VRGGFLVRQCVSQCVSSRISIPYPRKVVVSPYSSYQTRSVYFTQELFSFSTYSRCFGVTVWHVGLPVYVEPIRFYKIGGWA